MKKQLQVGLLVEGNSSKSTTIRLPNLADEIGPIKSTALRVARRLSNFLRAGYAVATYEDLQSADVILIRVPDTEVPRIVNEICRSDLILKDLSVVLCETWLPSDALAPLAERGASVATLVDVPASRRRWFVVEGEPTAVRQIKRLVDLNDARALEIEAGSKSLYFGASILATALPIPLFLLAQQAMRACGLEGNHLGALLDEMAMSMLRDFSKGARNAWGGPLTECSKELAEQHLHALKKNEPQLADVLERQLAWGRQLLPKARRLHAE